MKKRLNIIFLAALLTLLLISVKLIAADNPVSSPAKATTGEFHKFFLSGGWLVWMVLLPLSIITVSLITQNFLTVRRTRLIPTDIPGRVKRFIENAHYQDALNYLTHHGSLLSRTLHVGLAETKNGRVAMENAMAEMIDQDATNLLRKIEWLNIIGNVAPMIGLFGTVWGMINAFNGIVSAGGQPEPADLAEGISVALVTTWWGLLVAIPALATYGVLRNRIDAFAAEISLIAENLLLQDNQLNL